MASRSSWVIEKTEAVGDSGVVAAKHPLSSEVGAEILRVGGNAVDAAVATAFVESVVEPAMTGIGGGGNMVIYLAAPASGYPGETAAIEYGMKSPGAAHAEMFELAPGRDSHGFAWRNTQGEANIYGYRAAAVPGTVAGLLLALERFGTMSREEVIAPAARIAREGFAVSFYDSLLIGREIHHLRLFPESARTFLQPFRDDWRVPNPEPPERIVQRDLADTLELVAKHGREGFYGGDVADAIDRDMRANGGIITAADLAAYEPRLHTGFVGRYRDHGVVTAPWGNGGVTMLQTLKLLSGFDLARLGHNSPEALHLFIEAARRAFADRFRYVADPDQADVPWRGLLSDEYADERRREIDAARASSSYAPGDPWRHQEAPSGRAVTVGEPPLATHHTTHLCTLDRHGNAVSLTQTLMSAFGSRVVVPGTGIVLNNGMMWFDPEPGNANSVGPNKRALSNMTPLIAFRDGRARLVVGASGGRKIMNCNTQITLNVLDHGLGIQDAISAPRIDCSTAENLLDDRVPADVQEALRGMGHSLRVRTESFQPHFWASPVGIAVGADGRPRGGVHRFYPAVAVGV
jgi:gamma-glutamyltranspeptidase/glutathione hydrolase